MKKQIIISCLLLTVGQNMNAQQGEFPKLSGSYFGQKPPTNEPVLFAPGIVSNGADHHAVAFNPEGNEMYWEVLVNGIPKVGFSTIVNGVWTKPDLVSFCKNDTYIYGNPFVSPDGNKLFFTSFRPGAVSKDKENIWYAEKTITGWSNPNPVNSIVNSLRVHWSLSVAQNGNLYFQGSQLDGNKEGGIYYSKFVNGEYTKPVRMSEEINNDKNETCPFVAPDESYILFNRFDMMEPTNSGIFISFRDKSGHWAPAVRMLGGSPDKGGMSPRITYDGKYLFYANRGIYWMPLGKLIEDLRSKE
jgi:hypothetical protein